MYLPMYGQKMDLAPNHDILPFLKPPSAVVRFAEKKQVKLLADNLNMEFSSNKNFNKYKGYIGIYPCMAADDICAILYKPMRKIRFATKEELKELYLIFR